ncbi:MAG: N-acetyltransferase [Deltaproteobacteria bacterium]|nr:N-acetyltransferase [Deltaproteobacteria bacterium]
MNIRDEKRTDEEAIFTMTAAAFENMPYSRQTEPYIVNALRAAGALTISLVAEIDGEVVGHVAFSPVEISDGSRNWYTLGPVSVAPAFQNRGVGGALIIEGLAKLKSLGAEGCLLVGDPAYYTRFNFRNDHDMHIEGVPPENLLVLPFHGRTPKGAVTIHEGFFATS